jgi:hypothetical protein
MDGGGERGGGGQGRAWWGRGSKSSIRFKVTTNLVRERHIDLASDHKDPNPAETSLISTKGNPQKWSVKWWNNPSIYPNLSDTQSHTRISEYKREFYINYSFCHVGRNTLTHSIQNNIWRR